MFQNLKEKFEAKRAVWAEETQARINNYAILERRKMLAEMKRKETLQSLLNSEVSKYLKTVLPTFLLKPEASRALLNMLHARSEGTVSINLNMTKEMRQTHLFYHNELDVFITLLERKGFVLEGNEDLFLTSFLTTLREYNYRLCIDVYGDFVPDDASLLEAFDRYFETVEDKFKYESGNVDFFAAYLNQKGIVDGNLTKSRLKRKLKQYEKANKHEFKLKKLERKLQNIS
ncbi:hypothetical protein HXA31_11415 [Salipaludibacillus agaradhaerens]|uniref:Uncharacterized protein n=1 Tax=Salipaludibacillus agaradhaerens TaxID=76935 RepID=A0A9Q4AZF2_SALAG|nr:hypothetical protein [Salipaludibacillus agaradhaerens]MCR6095453.1 hypothetical protein [Salipaludibacillus agaradhaerens]MCR6114987.1 hypothetical protein [Salipaludibacillus agaradhaerens]